MQQILEQICSERNLGYITFQEGPISYRHLRAIDRIDNPQFYPESSDAADVKYDLRFPGDRDREVEEEDPQHLTRSGAPSRTLSLYQAT